MRNRGSGNIGDKRIVLVLTAFFALHFVVTVAYVIPDHYFPKKLNSLFAGYMMPVFHQAWDLFAPDPPLKEKQLQFRVKSEGRWMDWMDPGKGLLDRHNRFRLSNANIAYRLHQNAAFRVWQEVFRAEEIAERHQNQEDGLNYLLNSRGYEAATHYAGQWTTKHHQIEFDSLQIRLIIGTPPPFGNQQLAWETDTITLAKDVVR